MNSTVTLNKNVVLDYNNLTVNSALVVDKAFTTNTSISTPSLTTTTLNYAGRNTSLFQYGIAATFINGFTNTSGGVIDIRMFQMGKMVLINIASNALWTAAVGSNSFRITIPDLSGTFIVSQQISGVMADTGASSMVSGNMQALSNSKDIVCTYYVAMAGNYRPMGMALFALN